MDKRYKEKKGIVSDTLAEGFMQMERLIKEQPKLENTAGFKHFKLYSDSTLKNTSKDDLIDYLHMIYANWKYCDIQLNNVIKENYRISNKLVNWISVKDRLPKSFVNVLVTFRRYLSDDYFIDILYLNEKDEFVNYFGEINGEPIAWMPLPKPYKGDYK